MATRVYIVFHFTIYCTSGTKNNNKYPVTYKKRYNLLSFESFTDFSFLKLVYKCINRLLGNHWTKQPCK